MLKLNHCFGLAFYELAARPKIIPASPFKVLVRIISCCPVNRIWLECSF